MDSETAVNGADRAAPSRRAVTRRQTWAAVSRFSQLPILCTAVLTSASTFPRQAAQAAADDTSGA